MTRPVFEAPSSEQVVILGEGGRVDVAVYGRAEVSFLTGSGFVVELRNDADLVALLPTLGEGAGLSVSSAGNR